MLLTEGCGWLGNLRLDICLTRNGDLYRVQSMKTYETRLSACLLLHRLSTSQMLMEQCHEVPRLSHGHWKARLPGLTRNPLDSLVGFFTIFFFPLPLAHSKTVYKIFKMELSLHFLPLLLPPSQLPVFTAGFPTNILKKSKATSQFLPKSAVCFCWSGFMFPLTWRVCLEEFCAGLCGL